MISDLTRARNITSFVDSDIETGADWPEEINTAIDDAKVAILLVSQAWIDSDPCQAELKRCLDKKLDIVWVPLGQKDESWPDELENIQAPIDITQPLQGINDGQLANAMLKKVRDAVLDRLDPIWSPAQSVLPSRIHLSRKIEERPTTVLYMAVDQGLERRLTVQVVKNSEHNSEFAASVRRASQLGHLSAFQTVHMARLYTETKLCVSDYIDGRSLRSHIDNRTWRWDAGDAVQLVLRLGGALDSVDAHGFYHRDLRPSEILLDDNRNAFMSGVARAEGGVGEALLDRARDDSIDLTLSEEHVCYMAPEHCYPLDESAREQCDQYQLGLVVYELMSRNLPPTTGNSLEEVMDGAMPVFTDLPLLHSVAPGCPHELSRIIARMTSICPSDRYSELSEALDALQALVPISLTFARGSFKRCTSNIETETEFFKTFYEELCKSDPEVQEKFEEFTDKQWTQQYRVLKDGILMLFAYDASSPAARRPPNFLTRLAERHGPSKPGVKDDKLGIKDEWYDHFVAALIQAVLKHDVDCSDAERRPFIAQAWKVIVLPGIRYMRQHSK